MHNSNIISRAKGLKMNISLHGIIATHCSMGQACTVGW